MRSPVLVAAGLLVGTGLLVAAGLLVGSLLVGSLAATLTPLPAGATSGSTTPPGLSATEHAALASVGAFSAHPVKVLLLGDSITLTMGLGLVVGARARYGVDIANHSTLGCDLDPASSVRLSGLVGPATNGCVGWPQVWSRLTARVRPQVVALGLGRWEISDHYYEGHWVHVGERHWDAHLAAELRSAIGIFHSFGARVVLFTMPYIDPPDRQPDGQPWPENTAQRTRAFNQVVDGVAHSDRRVVTVIDLNKMLSPHGAFTAVLDGIRVRWTDGIHVTKAGGELLRRRILPELDRLALPLVRTRS